MEDGRRARITILFQQKRYAEAEKVIKDLLASNATDVYLLSLLAEANLQQDKTDIAQRTIDNAIGLAPDSARLHYIKARIFILQGNYNEAEYSIKESVSLDPYTADSFAMYAHIKLVRKQYKEALELADQALEIDAENLLGLNIRSTALLKLKRSDESFNTIEGALREDPNNAYTHANYGWGLLEKGNHKKAMEHFKEALKNDPNFSYAQSGMMEAIKATNPAYRLFLKYSFWIGNLTSKYKWMVIIGFYIGMNILKNIARTNEALQPFLVPIILALAIFAFSTWVINPISNLFLRFNRYGKFLLGKKEKISSNFVAVSLILFITGTVLYLLVKDEKYLTITVFGFAMMLPFSVMLSPSKYNSLLIFTLTLAAAGTLAIAITFSTGEIFNAITPIFILGFIAFQWVANYLIIKRSSR